MRANMARVTFFALICGLFISNTPAMAAPVTNATSAAAPAPKATPSPFGVAAGISKTVSLYDFKDGSRVEQNSFELVPSYNWSLGKTLVAMSFSDDVRDPGNSDMGDIAVVTAFKPWDFSRFKLSSSLSLIVPQSKESKLNTNLQTAINGKLSASIQQKLLQPGFRFGASLGAGRSIHRYDTAVDGRVLNQYSSSQSLSGGYEFGRFSFDVDFTHINTWSYRGNMKEAYEHSEEVSASLNEHFGLAIGHTNGGSVFKADGYSSNYQLINENNSLVYAKLSMQY